MSKNSVVILVLCLCFKSHVWSCDEYCQFLEKAKATNIDLQDSQWQKKLYQSVRVSSFGDGQINSFRDLNSGYISSVGRKVRSIQKNQGPDAASEYALLRSYIMLYQQGVPGVEVPREVNISQIESSLDQLDSCVSGDNKTERQKLICNLWSDQGVLLKESDEKYSIRSIALGDLKLLEESKQKVARNLETFDESTRPSKKAISQSPTKKWERKRKSEVDSLHDSRKVISSDGELQCYVEPDIGDSQNNCKPTDYRRVVATKAFKQNYLKELGESQGLKGPMSLKQVEKALVGYCRSFKVKNGKISSMSIYDFKRKKALIGDMTRETNLCYGDILSNGKCSSLEDYKGKGSPLLIPMWKGDGSDSWNSKDIWSYQILKDKYSTQNTSESIKCNGVHLENYFSWACSAKMGLPKCIEDSTSMKDSLNKNFNKVKKMFQGF